MLKQLKSKLSNLDARSQSKNSNISLRTPADSLKNQEIDDPQSRKNSVSSEILSSDILEDLGINDFPSKSISPIDSNILNKDSDGHDISILNGHQRKLSGNTSLGVERANTFDLDRLTEVTTNRQTIQPPVLNSSRSQKSNKSKISRNSEKKVSQDMAKMPKKTGPPKTKKNSRLAMLQSKNRYPSTSSVNSASTQIIRKTYDHKTGLMKPDRKYSQNTTTTMSASHVTERVLSATHRKNQDLQDINSVLKQKTDEQKKEILLLKSLQRKQENDLAKFEGVEAELPKLLDRHAEERRIDRANLRKYKEKERDLTTRINNLIKEMSSKDNEIDRLKNIVNDKSLADADLIRRKLAKTEREFQFLKNESEDRQKKFTLDHSALERQFKSEKKKSNQLVKEIDNYRKINMDLNAKLRASERAMNNMNLYARSTSTMNTSNISINNPGNQRAASLTGSNASTTRKSPKYNANRFSKISNNSSNNCENGTSTPKITSASSKIPTQSNSSIVDVKDLKAIKSKERHLKEENREDSNSYQKRLQATLEAADHHKNEREIEQNREYLEKMASEVSNLAAINKKPPIASRSNSSSSKHSRSSLKSISSQNKLEKPVVPAIKDSKLSVRTSMTRVTRPETIITSKFGSVFADSTSKPENISELPVASENSKEKALRTEKFLQQSKNENAVLAEIEERKKEISSPTLDDLLGGVSMVKNQSPEIQTSEATKNDDIIVKSLTLKEQNQ